MTATLEGGEWSAALPGRTLPPWKDRVPILQEAGWASGPVIYCVTLWYIVLHCDILYYTVLYCDVLWYTGIYCYILWYTVLYLLHCDILCYTVIYCVILWYTVITSHSADGRNINLLRFKRCHNASVLLYVFPINFPIAKAKKYSWIRHGWRMMCVLLASHRRNKF